MLGSKFRSRWTLSFRATYKIDGLVGTFCETFHKILCLLSGEFPACSSNRDWYKSWLIACTYPAMKSLGSQCPHPAGIHANIAGAKTAEGVCKSRATAEYPVEMCQVIAGFIAPLCSPSQRQLLDLDTVRTYIPIKQLNELPMSYEVGNGFFSEPDWRRPLRSAPDCLHELRRQWVQMILADGVVNTSHAFFASDDVQASFTDHDIQLFKQSVSDFIQEHDMIHDWSTHLDQHMHLEILAALSQILDDKDSTLFPMLRERAPTGLDNDIPSLGCFPTAIDKTVNSTPLSIPQTHWPSAESDSTTTRELVLQAFGTDGIFQYQGSLEAAHAEFSTKLAISRLGLATSDNRSPRLVVASSIYGVPSRCHIPERATHMGSVILTYIHFLLWWSHTGFIYVDDFFFLFPKKVAWIMTCIYCIFARALNLPNSWRKTEFSLRVQWSGWQFHITAEYINLPTNKIDELSEYISSMLRFFQTPQQS